VSPAQVIGELIATRRVGAYHQLTFLAPGVAELGEPGQFVALAVGGDTTANLLRRCFSIHRADSTPIVSPGGLTGGTVDVVVAARGPGTRWLTGLGTGQRVSIVGPLGRGFVLPDQPTACVLVGGGYGSAPLFWLADVLRERGCPVEMVLGAASADRLFGVAEALSASRASSASRVGTARTAGGAGRETDGVTVTTDDGSMGTRGWVSEVLPEVIAASSAEVVYGCGPMAMLKVVTELAAAHGAASQVAVEESMACGIGVCMTCVMPVVGDDGSTRMARTCVEGPVLRGDRVRWDAFDNGWCRVPDDAYGADAMTGQGGH